MPLREINLVINVGLSQLCADLAKRGGLLADAPLPLPFATLSLVEDALLLDVKLPEVVLAVEPICCSGALEEADATVAPEATTFLRLLTAALNDLEDELELTLDGRTAIGFDASDDDVEDDAGMSSHLLHTSAR